MELEPIKKQSPAKKWHRLKINPKNLRWPPYDNCGYRYCHLKQLIISENNCYRKLFLTPTLSWQTWTLRPIHLPSQAWGRGLQKPKEASSLRLQNTELPRASPTDRISLGVPTQFHSAEMSSFVQGTITNSMFSSSFFILKSFDFVTKISENIEFRRV